MSDKPNDPGGVWCRACGSLEYGTVRTYQCLEGTIRVHQCDICGGRFNSIATYMEASTARADPSRKFTAFRDLILAVQARRSA
jgi:hypothetical protein